MGKLNSGRHSGTEKFLLVEIHYGNILMQTPVNLITAVDTVYTSGWPEYDSWKRQVRQRYDNNFNETEVCDFLIYLYVFKEGASWQFNSFKICLCTIMKCY
jgi:hypothetical protein